MRKHNFFAGPSILPESATEATAAAINDFHGVSLASISHRSKEFEAVMNEAQDLFKELLNIPEGYSVLFLGGGASLQFAMIPYNYMHKKAAYLNTGTWAKKAVAEAKLFGEVVDIKAADYTAYPENWKAQVPADVDYVHITTNNTIAGTEYLEDPDFDMPLIADMSSDIMSRPVDVSKYALIYGGGQKNVAPSGLTFVIVKDELLGKVERQIPTMLNYKTHIDKGSMFNTPPVIP
ncbi:MAG: 3-phosphoserine/phosphohydroxythreonine transaminase, partial [Bacteroidota bacterium]|nr:3-phosphoserine/phosphohydroxythreonine transaminase [Bacteroidota bacterium]